MRLLLTIMMLVSLIGVLTAAEPQTGEEIPWQVIASGGRNDGTSTNFGVAGTVGQTATGVGGSTNFGVAQGFWTGGTTGGPGYICGDANADELVNITDAVYLIQYIFNGGDPPLPVEAGDANCDEITNITDAVYLIQYIFNGGAAPCADCP